MLELREAGKAQNDDQMMPSIQFYGGDGGWIMNMMDGETEPGPLHRWMQRLGLDSPIQGIPCYWIGKPEERICSSDKDGKTGIEVGQLEVVMDKIRPKVRGPRIKVKLEMNYSTHRYD